MKLLLLGREAPEYRKAIEDLQREPDPQPTDDEAPETDRPDAQAEAEETPVDPAAADESSTRPHRPPAGERTSRPVQGARPRSGPPTTQR